MAFRISMSPPPDGVFVSTPRIVGWTERTYRLYRKPLYRDSNIEKKNRSCKSSLRETYRSSVHIRWKRGWSSECATAAVLRSDRILMDRQTINLGGPVKTSEDQWNDCLAGPPVQWNLKSFRGVCKSFGGPVKLGFSMWLPVLRSGKGPKVFPMSAKLTIILQMVAC